MAQIDKPNLHFNTKLYTGNGSTQSITGVGFQPDWVWVKERTSTSSHQLVDAVRGYNKRMFSNSASAEAVDSSPYNDFKSFDSDGFSIGNGGAVNENSQTYAAWNWKANGQGSSNTDGSINTTYTSANTTAGFSIVSYTGTGSNPATVGHGLGATPKMIVVKPRSIAYSWCVYHQEAGNNNLLYYDTNGAAGGSSVWNSTSPTNSVFTVNDNQVNKSGETHIAYCFAEKNGYSKFGKYIGNGNANGTFIYTGFRPAFIMVKRSDGGSENWFILDNKRDDGMNPRNSYIMTNSNSAEDANNSTVNTDFLSNGFKLRATTGALNGSGNTYIYMAFAENPIVGSNNIPATAT